MIGISSAVSIGWHAGLRDGTPVPSSLGYYMTTTEMVCVYGTHLRKCLLDEVSGGIEK